MEISKFEQLRDCVREAYLKGCQRGYEFQKMRHALIAELKRLGYDSPEIKSLLAEWNDRCERPLNPGEMKRQLFRYVDWFDNHDCKIGCKALRDFCPDKNRCQFHIQENLRKRKETPELPFDMNNLENFLNIRFKHRAKGRMMAIVVKAIRQFQIENGKEIVLVGYRGIASIIRDSYGYSLEATEIQRIIYELADEGVLEIALKGKAGEFHKKSNGYRFLPWTHPEETTHKKTKEGTYVRTEEGTQESTEGRTQGNG